MRFQNRTIFGGKKSLYFLYIAIFYQKSYVAIRTFAGTNPGLLAEGFDWAATSPSAANQTFNFTNGDLLVPAHAWSHIAERFGLETGGEPPASLSAFFAEEVVEAAWTRLSLRHGLRIGTISKLLGESHHYVDLLLSARIAAKSVPVLLSTIKIRQAGFGACRDSRDSMLHWLGRMAELKLLPPMRGP